MLGLSDKIIARIYGIQCTASVESMLREVIEMKSIFLRIILSLHPPTHLKVDPLVVEARVELLRLGLALVVELE